LSCPFVNNKPDLSGLLEIPPVKIHAGKNQYTLFQTADNLGTSLPSHRDSPRDENFLRSKNIQKKDYNYPKGKFIDYDPAGRALV
jgi:hypothetical protein